MKKKNCMFCKIIKKKIPSKIVYQDSLVTAFLDKKPVAPIHILIVPNKLIPTLNHIKEQDKYTVGHMVFVAASIAKKLKISKNGYRLIINCNKHAGQVIYHIHFHLLGGKNLGPLLK